MSAPTKRRHLSYYFSLPVLVAIVFFLVAQLATRQRAEIVAELADRVAHHEADDATAALRQWGLGEEAQQLAQRPLADQAIHPPHGDVEQLRLTAALANELVDALQLADPKRRKLQLEVTVRRYARALNLSGKDVQLALFPEAAQASVQSP